MFEMSKQLAHCQGRPCFLLEMRKSMATILCVANMLCSWALQRATGVVALAFGSRERVCMHMSNLILTVCHRTLCIATAASQAYISRTHSVHITRRGGFVCTSLSWLNAAGDVWLWW
jgi:hypothetical protein